MRNEKVGAEPRTPPSPLPPSLHYSSLPAERDERRRETCLEAGTPAGPGEGEAGLRSQQ